MERLLEDLQHEGFRGDVLLDEPLAAHTSWKLGGPADYFIVPSRCKDLQLLLRLTEHYRFPWLVIGNGSNLLVADRGIRGLVIHTGGLNGIRMLPDAQVEVEAGMQLTHLIRKCCWAGLGGLEALLGIPGTVGGALLMNAGALDTEIGDLVREVVVVDGQGERSLPREQIDFGYRHSDLGGQGVICRTVLQLAPVDRRELEERCAAVSERRRQVQRVLGAHAGSVFKNPPGAKAWQLIDQAGLRGRRCGEAQIAEEHCNHIVNHGRAKASEVMALIEEARAKVREVCGVELELEVRLAGWEAEG